MGSAQRVYSTGTQSVFYKLVHTTNFCSQEFKTGSKLSQNDGKRVDKVSWSSLEGFFLQVISFKIAWGDILPNMTGVPGF